MIKGWLRKTIHLAALLLLALLVSACGGGGGGGDSSFTGSSQQQTDYSLSLSLTDSNGNDVTELNSGDSASLVVTVTQGNSAVSGVVVELEASGASTNPTSSTTDAAGKSNFTVVAGDSSGAATLKASVDGPNGVVTEALNFNVVSQLPNIALTLTNLDDEPITAITPVEKGLLKIVLTDASDAPLGEHIVSADTTIGKVVPDSGTALTDANGYTYFIIEANGDNGAGTATASVSVGNDTASASLNFSVSSTIPFELTLLAKDSEGNSVSTVETGQRFDIEVVVKNSDTGELVPNQLVLVNIGELGTLIPASGTAITQNDGRALFSVATGQVTGAFPISATTTLAGGEIGGQASVTVTQASRKLGYFEADGAFVEGKLKINPAKALSPGGTAAVSFAVVDEALQRVRTEEKVTLSSECLFSALATIDPQSPVTFIGQTSILYTVNGCLESDAITATLESTGAEATGEISMAQAVAEVIRFEDAAPSIIAIRDTGSASDLSESALVNFKVTDLDGNAVSDARVNFSLEQSNGGIALYCSDNDFCEFSDSLDTPAGRSRTASDRSDLEGLATARVMSGYVATPVRVLAYVDLNDNDIQDEGEPSSISKSLVVSTGLPDQNSVSLSASVLNVEGAYDTDGITSTITVRMADKFNNPVPDGTPVTFTTELGSIVGSCETSDGACSVDWTSQSPRISDVVDQYTSPITIYENLDSKLPSRYKCPSHRERGGPCPDDIGDEKINPPGAPRGGRTTILATAIGEETFVDANGNGLYDQGEFWTNLTEAYRDDNEDGLFTPMQRANCAEPSVADDVCLAGFEEIFIDYNFNGQFDLNNTPEADSYDLPDGLFNGVLCRVENEGAGVCSRDLLNVRGSVVVVNSFFDANNFSLMAIASSRYEPKVLTGGNTYTLYVSDYFNNPPPAGSEISYEGSGRCDVITPSPTIGDSNRAGAFAVSFAVSTEDGAEPTSDPDQVTMILTLPSGSKTVKTYACYVIDPPDPADCGFSPQPPGCS